MADSPKAFVCGHPIAHSRSPKIHGFWLKRYGLYGSYEAIDVAPENIETFLGGLGREGFAGGNITLPHKEAALRCADVVEAAAEAIGAANTLWLEDGRLHAGNTDSFGFSANLDQRAPTWSISSRKAVVLGAGGSSRAIIHALLSNGFDDIRVVNRTVDRARSLADHFGRSITAHEIGATRDVIGDVGLVVNTTSLGMKGVGDLPANPDWMRDDAIVTDLVYVPLETPFLAAARRRGLKTVDGLGMLLHQAVPGFEKWFGRRPEVTEELRALIVADLGPSA